MQSQPTGAPWPKKVLISLALLLCGLLVFVLGSNYYSVFPTNDSQLYRAVLAVAFLAAALVLRRKGAAEPYGQIAYAFFVATVAFLLTSLTAPFRDTLLGATHIADDSPAYVALIKVFEAVLVIATILALNALWGGDLQSLYINKGRLGLGVFLGGSLMVINTATGIVAGAALGHSGEELLAQLPWLLLFSLANGLMEELWFRGLFLRQMASVVGVVGAVVVTSVVFTVSHAAASYMNPVEAVMFQIIILPMALLLATLMHKTEGLWGSALYHAGSDVFLLYLLGW